MTECRQIESLLPPYVDGDAPSDVVARVESHLATCGTCRDYVAAERFARRVVRARASQLTTAAPPGLRTRLAASLRPEPTPKLGWVGRLTAFGAAAAVILALVIGFEFLSPRSSALFAAQLAIDHVRCFVVGLGGTEATDDNQEVQRAFAERYGWQVDVPASSPSLGLKLVGARRCPFGVGNHAHLMYRSGDHEVSL
jgi:anti-sigma factor RsiW